MSRRPRVLFVGASSYAPPLAEPVARKWDAVGERIDWRVVARAAPGARPDPRFRLLPRAAFYPALPAVVARELRSFRPDALIAQSPYDAFAVLPALSSVRSAPRLIVEVHGDWRTAARAYGSPARRLYASLAERAALTGLARADGTRGLSPFTGGLAEAATGRRPDALFPTYFDLRSFLAEPPRSLPAVPSAVWIGVLQRYKDPVLLADAWDIVAASMPSARLTVVGDGPLRQVIERLRAAHPSSVTWRQRLSPLEVARALDDATLLALTSPNEGLGRVIIEAFTRGRAVVACRGGGVVDLVEPEVNGLLATPGDASSFATSLLRVLGDADLASRFGDGALRSSLRWRWTPDRYAAELRGLVDRVLAAR